MDEMTITPEEGIAPVPAIGEQLPEDTVITGELLIAPAPAPEEDKPTVLDNVLTIGIVAAIAVAVMVMVIRKLTAKKKPAPAPVSDGPAAEPTDVPTGPAAPGAAGEVKLHNVEPKTAAMLMAIVADKMQKPINELRFISIKEVE